MVAASKLRMLLTGTAFFAALPALAQAQATDSRLIGEVTGTQPTANKLSMRTDDGQTVTVALEDSARCVTVPPGVTDLRQGFTCTLKQIETGDRVLARGRAGSEPGALAANLVVVMKKSDLARKHEQELEEWRQRGVAGRITRLDAEKQEIHLAPAALQGSTTFVLETTEGTRFRRYASNSIRFRDAHPSSFDELRAGDQVRALGVKSGDGTRIAAEEVIAGSFPTIVATVTSVDPQAGTIEAMDLETGRRVTLRATEETVVRRLPERMAQVLRWRIQGGGEGAAPASRGAAAPGGPPRDASFQQLLERMPRIGLEEVKPEEPIVVSVAAEAGDGPRKAFTVVAGVEPLLTASPREAGALAGMWNLEIDVMQ